MRRLIVIVHVIILAIMPLRTAYAEIRLDTWQSYGAMAEQGGVCAAFARLMELQSIIDVQHGALWFERRKYAGSLIRQASILEGLPPVEQEEIDLLIDSYASWLISNLSNQDTNQNLDNEAHTAASKMINDVCSDLYARADNTIMQAHPELASCPAVKTPEPLSCKPAEVEAQTPITQPAISNATDMTLDLLELKRARDEVAMLAAQNKSLRAKLKKLRSSVLENENISSDYTNVAVSQSVTDSSFKTDTNIETDNDAPPSLASRSRLTTPDLGVMKPDKKKQEDHSKTLNQTTTSPITTAAGQNRKRSNLFVAQLGSYASPQQANDGIHYLKTAFRDTFKATGLSVIPKTSRSGKRVYDLVTDKSDRAEIEHICNFLWEQRFGCFVTAAN